MNSHSGDNQAAAPDPLSILRSGVKAWNEWRRAQQVHSPSLRIVDLSGANLSRMDLQGVNLDQSRLTRTNFASADLRNADLSGAQLIQANFTGVRLSNASLAGADLRAANLEGADLSRAVLRAANMFRADLSSAYLFGTDLTAAIFGQTILGNTNLAGALSLETCIHQAPSTVGIDTIYRSEGRIPEAFLRGAGVPENFIAYMHSLVGAAFEFYSCFISYSAKDQEFAERLYADLQAKGVRCWYAPEDLRVGSRFRQQIDSAIRLHDKLLVVLSESSVKSGWVEKEVEAAFERERQEKKPVLFAIRLDDAVMETAQSWANDIRRTRHVGDFRNWHDSSFYSRTFARLLRDLRAAD